MCCVLLVVGIVAFGLHRWLQMRAGFQPSERLDRLHLIATGNRRNKEGRT
jgi:cell division protein FtsW (lipid II flippase)